MDGRPDKELSLLDHEGVGASLVTPLLAGHHACTALISLPS
jgi:hypothetical protein